MRCGTAADHVTVKSGSVPLSDRTLGPVDSAIHLTGSFTEIGSGTRISDQEERRRVTGPSVGQMPTIVGSGAPGTPR